MINLLKAWFKLDLDNKKIFLIILASLIIIYIDFTSLIRLQFKNIKNTSLKIIQLRKDKDDLDKELARMQDLKYKQDKKEQKGVPATQKIIFKDQIPLLLQDISSAANKNKVKIIRILPYKELKAKEETGSKGLVKFIPVLITLDLSCGYHRLGMFINDLENADKFMTAEEIRITVNPADYFQENVNLVLKTYVKK